MYVKEVDKIKDKLNKEKESNVEDYYIKKTNEYLQESESTRDAVRGKLRNYLDELMSLLAEMTNDDIKDSEEFKTATDIVATCKEIFKESTEEKDEVIIEKKNEVNEINEYKDNKTDNNDNLNENK